MRKTKKTKTLLLTVAIVVIFSIFAMASSESSTDKQDSGSAEKAEATDNLGSYNVEINSCRLAKDYEGKDVVIVKYIFTNNSDNPQSFSFSIEDNVFQNGIGLNESLFVSDNAGYSSDNQMKEIKKGSSLEVEVAYELNDTTTDIDVEVSELISFSDDIVTKSFSIAQ